MTHGDLTVWLEGVHPAARSGAGDHGQWADSRGRGRAAGGRRLGPSRPAGAGRLGRRLPARGRGEPPGARPCRPRGRPTDRSTSRARGEGATGRPRHAGLRQPSRGRHRAPLLARPGTVGGGRHRGTGGCPGHLADPRDAGTDRGRPLRPDGGSLRPHRPGDADLRLPRARLGRRRRRGRRRPQPHPDLVAGAHALTANSPFWQGEDTGYASFRSQAWHRWPSAGPNELFADAAEYHQLIDQVLATGTVLDTGMVYFDARLSTTWPTVEVRTADVALRVEDAVTLAGIVRGLVETAARNARAGNPPPDVPAPVLRVATWRAGRSGLTGDLVHPLTGRPAPAADVLGALLDHVRPALADAGDEERVTEGLSALLRRGTDADLQRRVHEETGDLAAVVRAAVAVTAGRPDGTAQAADRATG